MSYVVEGTYHNGYRCLCCARDWEREPIWCDTLEEALTHLPVEPPLGEFDPLEVTIKDGQDGSTVAWGRLSWPQAVGRARVYHYSRWQGDRPDTGPFDMVVTAGGAKVTDRTWDQVVDALTEEYAQEKLREAEANFAKAQRDLAAAQTKSKN